MPSPAALQTEFPRLQHLAQREAKRICRIARLPGHEADDIRQDMLLDLLPRLSAFDPARGSVAAFAVTCFRHRGSRIMRRRGVSRRIGLGGQDTGSRRDDQDDACDQADTNDAIGALELRLDLARACAVLDEADAALCVALSNCTAHALARRTGASRAGLYRRMHEIRMRMLAAGIAG